MVDADAPRTRRTLDRDELLRSVADFIRSDGLHNFSLRRAAVAAGTTHKVLLYHFGSADNLILEANDLLRADAAAGGEKFLSSSGSQDISAQLATFWKYWERMDGSAPVFHQMIGLAMSDPARFGEAGRRATLDNLDTLMAHIDQNIGIEQRRILATLALALVRGLSIDRAVTRDRKRTDRAFEAFTQLVAESSSTIG